MTIQEKLLERLLLKILFHYEKLNIGRKILEISDNLYRQEYKRVNLLKNGYDIIS